MPWSDAITEVFRFLNNRFASPKRQISKVVNIYDAIHRVLEETNVERFLIFKAHNGGGVISPNGDLFISTLYEGYKEPFTSVKSKYQKLPVDIVYAKMLLEIIRTKKVDYNVEDIPEGILKDIYLKEGVKKSLLYFLGQDRKNVYFCSCASSQDIIYDEIAVDLGVNVVKLNIR